jgi:hypothetical protein
LKKRDSVGPAPTNFNYDFTYVTTDGFTISKGDLIKIRGEYGVKFTFHSLTTNKVTGSEWIDCFEVSRGQVGALRSFRIERLKRIPTRGKRGKRVV